MSRRCVSSSCLSTSESVRPRFCSVICALKASMPPYWMYRGGLPPVTMSGRYFSASSSHVVTCARISFTDQLPITPGSVSCESDKPVYDSFITTHAFSSLFRSWCLSIVQVLFLPLLCSISHSAGVGYLILAPKLPPSEFIQNVLFLVKAAKIPAQ